MRRSILILLILCGFLSESLSQTHVYAGGGVSTLKMDWMIGEIQRPEDKSSAWSYNLSLLARTKVSNSLALFLGVLYNVNGFENDVSDLGINPIINVNIARYAIPLRFQWTVYQNVYLSGGIMFNSFYRVEHILLYTDSEVYEHNIPEVNFTFGAGVEWRRFLLDIGVARNLKEPQVMSDDHYWTIDFNVYYRILSSGKE